MGDKIYIVIILLQAVLLQNQQSAKTYLCKNNHF